MAAAAVAKTLAAADKALAAGDRNTALSRLLAAWREIRHPRIADLVDFVSNEITLAAEPIKGKTVAKRQIAWHEVEKKKDEADLGRLLATPWPGTWQKALPVLTPLLARDDDPRVAVALARIIDETRYPTWTASRFYRPLFVRFNELKDLRTLPLLRAQLGKQKPYYYSRTMGSMEQGAVATLETAFPNGPPALEADVEAALAKVEGHYAGKILAQRSKATGEAEHLAAIYADPQDSARRAVYADWLTERQDPRGELIAIQLARAEGRSNDAADKRERALLEEHGRRWAGGLDEWFDKEPRLFDAGFFAGGVLRDVRGRDLNAVLKDPGWAAVHTLEAGWSGDDAILHMLDRPELRALRKIHLHDEQIAARIAGGPPRNLTALTFHEGRGEAVTDDVTQQLAACKALPQLRMFGLSSGGEQSLSWMAGAPVLERIQQLVLPMNEIATRWLSALERRAGSLREIELLPRYSRNLLSDAGWNVFLRRSEAPGPFTSLVATWRSGKGANRWGLVSRLEETLTAIPEGWLRALTIDASSAIRLKAEDRAKLQKSLVRFPALHEISAPWEITPTAAPKVNIGSGSRLSLQLQGTGMLDPKRIPGLWDLVTGDDGLGLRFDSFDVGYNDTLRPLGEDPLARLEKWAANKRTDRLEIFRDGHFGALRIGRDHGSSYGQTTGMDISLGERTPAEFAAWTARFLDFAPFSSGHCDLLSTERRERAPNLPFHHAPQFGWLMIFGPAFVPWLPAREVEALGRSAVLRGLFVLETKRNLLVGTAATPEGHSNERAVELRQRLRAILDRQLATARGYDFAEKAREHLGEVAAGLELAPVPHDPSGPMRVQFERKDDTGTRRMMVDLDDPLAEPKARVDLHFQPLTPGYQRLVVLKATAAGTRAQIDKALRAAAATLRKDGAAWFAHPVSR